MVFSISSGFRYLELPHYKPHFSDQVPTSWSHSSALSSSQQDYTCTALNMLVINESCLAFLLYKFNRKAKIQHFASVVNSFDTDA